MEPTSEAKENDEVAKKADESSEEQARGNTFFAAILKKDPAPSRVPE
jgi:hypothetical protein